MGVILVTATKNISQLPPAAGLNLDDIFEKQNHGTGQNQYINGSQLISFVQSNITVAGMNLSISGNTAGAPALISSGTAILAGGNNITLSQVGQSISIIGATAAGFALTLAGNTSGALALISTGTATFAGGNNVTLSQAGNAVTISAANQTVQTQNLHNVTLSGNTAGVLAQISSGTMTLAGGNNITLSQAGNAITISGAAVAGAGSVTLGMSNLGNTSGTTGVVSGSNVALFLAGGNNVTLSQSINGSSATITISAATAGGGTGIALSLSGNTSGVLALINTGTAILAGGNNITLSQNGQSVTISAANQTVQTQNCVDVTLAGNTSGALALISSGTMTLAGGNNVTLSQAGNAVTISAGAGGAAPTLSFYQNAWIMDSVQSNFVNPAINFGIPFILPITPDFGVFPGNMTINTFQMVFSQSGSTATMSQSFTSRLDVGIYTNNAGTLSLLNSASTSWGSNAANANLSSQYAGLRHLTIHSSQWSAQPTLSQGHYWLGYVVNSTNVAVQTALIVMFQMLPSLNIALFGTIGVSTGASLTNAALGPFMGSYTSSSASVPVSIVQESIKVGASPAGRVPFVIFNGMISSY